MEIDEDSYLIRKVDPVCIILLLLMWMIFF